MRRIISLLVILLTVNVVIAGNGENVLTNAIKKRIHITDVLTSDATVMIRLKVAENGRLIVDEVHSSNTELAKKIKAQLKDIQFEPTAELINKTIDYRFLVQVK